MTTSLEEVVGTIERIIFKSGETGFTVFTLKVNTQEAITVKGYTGQLHQGSQVVVKGSWIYHPKFGRQLEASECVAHLPTSADGIEKYLSSGLIKGIGPKFAEKLVRRFGDKTLEIIDKSPAHLLTIDGVGPRRVQAIVEAWHDQKEISRVMLFLRSKDVSPAYATKIFKTYGNQAVEKMQENPYRLIDDIWGVGFKIADQIALKLGLERNSMARIKAGIVFSIGQATDRGNLYIELAELKEEAVKALEISIVEHAPLLKQALQELYQEEKVKLISHKDKHYLTLPQFYFSEIGIARRLERLMERPSKVAELDQNAIYQQLRTPDARGIALNEDQQRGIMTCMQSKVSIITGGPGTGKTTLVKKLISLVESFHIRFRLAAPTGRAAKRMFESTGKNTETLHRLLEFGQGGSGFAKNEQNSLDLDLLIIDEASMIDVFLMHAILKAMPWNASLLLLGDVDQLPSVGAGNVLHDLIDSKKISVVRLTQIFRQAQDSMIVVNAHRVNNGEFPESPQPGSRRDFAFVKEEEPESVYPLLRKIYKEKLPKLGIPADDSIVLVPMNRGTVGTQRLNQELQAILNPTDDPEKQITQFGNIFKVNDRVMQIRNNYEKFVFNGDIGKIIDIDKTDQKFLVSFGERDLEYDFAELNELVHAYAISIHKSQGSEFGAVIIPIFMQHFILLQRNLIYTAITRAKKLCMLIGQPKAIAMGIRNNKGTERLTFLKQYMTTSLEAR
jgi:exodeoxyribonuclease V alpha subunit